MKVLARMTLISIAVIAVSTLPVAAKTIWDEVREAAPRTIFDDIRESAPRTVFDDIRDSAPKLPDDVDRRQLNGE